jgi:hypothetical protein
MPKGKGWRQSRNSGLIRAADASMRKGGEPEWVVLEHATAPDGSVWQFVVRAVLVK